MNRRKRAWLALNHLPGAGAVALRRLVSRFGSAQAVLEAPADELIAIGSLNPAQVQALERLVADPGYLDTLADELERTGTRLLTLEDDAYPANLRGLRDAPPLLYLRGSFTAADGVAIAVVGTRTPSAQGAAAAESVAVSLASRGVTVVSGLASGVDSAAHRGALTAGRTIAVLGSGIDRLARGERQNLAQEVIRTGALMSEVPPGTRASRETLLARNRIQAGLAKGVIVVQCRNRGGSFSTARRALAAGRPVLAVSWPQAEFAAGVERLEQLGAQPVSLSETVNLALEAAVKPLPQPQHLFEDTA